MEIMLRGRTSIVRTSRRLVEITPGELKSIEQIRQAERGNRWGTLDRTAFRLWGEGRGAPKPPHPPGVAPSPALAAGAALRPSATPCPRCGPRWPPQAWCSSARPPGL